METVKITNSGEGNFVIYAISSDRNLLVNEIGSWSGTEVLPTNTVAIEVLSDGTWTITPTS